MPANNLPIQVTSFIGREHELADLQRLLPTTRLLTLTGAGGTGKTRLALELAAAVLDQYPDGVWLVELAALSDPALVLVTIAATLGVRQEQGRPLPETLADWLRPRQLLLILDNCEHLIDECAQFAALALRSSTGTRILASSREALGNTGELAWRVSSLPAPDPAASITAQQLELYAATRLFLERARFVQASFLPGEVSAPAVAQICHRLDGIPLAIELAAARVSSLSVEQIAARLDEGFRLLTTGSRTALPRHQTLRSAIDWSHNLLSEPERTLLRRLSVFAGGWTLEAAEAVCAGETLETVEIVYVQARLVDKSLVEFHQYASTSRYRMLETVRQYAHAKLLEAGESELLRDRHLAFFQQLAERAEGADPAAQRVGWFPRLEADNDNLRAALDWACQRDLEGARMLAGRLWPFWDSGDHLIEARTWYARVLDGDERAETEGMAGALLGAGKVAALLLSLADAHRMLERSAGLFRALSNQTKLSESLACLSWVRVHEGDSEGAYAIFEANEATVRRYLASGELAGDLSWWGIALATARGQYAAARRLHEESLAIATRLEDSGLMANAWAHLGLLAELQGDYALARQHIQEGLRCYGRLGSRWNIAIKLGQLADVAYLQGDFSEARKLNDEALATFRAAGDQAHIAHIGVGLGHVSIRQGALDQAEVILTESMQITSKGQFRLGIARCLAGYADLRLAQGHPSLAVRLLACEPVQAQIPKSHIPIDHVRLERMLAQARVQLGEAAFDAAWAEGRGMAVEQAISEALREPVRGKVESALTPDPDALTVREAEVLRWLARGMSDREIAAQLVISVRTVHGHLRSIYSKLHVTSRRAAIRAGLERKRT